MPVINENYIQFFTAVCTDWLPILKNDECKDVIIRSLKYRMQTKEVGVAGFVIMPNHMHLIWQIQDGYVQDKIQQRFLKFTGQPMKFKMVDEKNKMPGAFLVEAKDRTYQIWERNSLSMICGLKKFSFKG